MILSCNCASDFMDARYGRGNRVHNPCGVKDASKARCVVCGNENTVKRADDKKKG